MLTMIDDRPALDADGRASATGTTKSLRISLGGASYALRLDVVREILEVAQLTPLPLMPSFVRGVMNLRGAVVPVIDLAARLGLAPTRVGRRSCVVIVDSRTADGARPQTLGVLVDAVFEVFDVDPAASEAPPRLGLPIDPAFVRAIARVRGAATPELDLDQVLDTATLARLIGDHRAAV